MALELGERGRKHAHDVIVCEQGDALGEAEEPQDVLGGGSPTRALLGVQGYKGRCSMWASCMAWRNSRSMRACAMRARKYTVNNASMRASFFRNTGAISCTDLSCSKRFSMRRLALVGGEHLGRGEAGVVCD